MEWMNWYLPDLSEYFQWYTILPGLLAHVLLPFTTFYFLCRYCMVSFRWLPGVCYTILSACVCVWEVRCHMQGSPGLLAEILLLTGCGCILLKRRRMEALTISVLILSVLSVSSGIMSWIGYRIILPFLMEYERWVLPSDTVRECFRLLLASILSVFILIRFRESVTRTNRQTLIQLTLPVFFISLVLRIIQTSIYGDDVQVDAGTGQILPALHINHRELLFLQIFACICLLTTLLSYQRILQIFQTEQKVRLLEQQTAKQEIYMQEAILRDRKTRAFRHDIRNHLTVLAELMKTGETDRAYEYLSHLEQAAAELSVMVQTGNAAVDALMGSKCASAEQNGIRVQCELCVPDQSLVRDTDWCILLSNALDNAVKACMDVPKEERRIRIVSRKRGNLFLLSVENSCAKDLQMLPEDGIGLSNIRAVAEKYHGTVENAVSGGTYRLRLLLCISATEKSSFTSIP